MTLRRKDGSGKFSLVRIGLLTGVVASVMICVEAAPTFFQGLSYSVAPWTKLPADVADIKRVQADNKVMLQAILHALTGPQRLAIYDESGGNGATAKPSESLTKDDR